MPSAKFDWHPADVKAALEKRGITQTALARAHDYDASAPGKALHRPWPAMERIIAAALGRKPQEIWPSRYDAAGNPLQERRGRKTSISRRPGHVQKRAAA